MSDLISRQKALDELKYEIKYGAVIDQCGLDTAYDIIKDLPSAELERKKGRWIKHIDDLFPEESTEECSECHEMQFIWYGKCDKYCPNCGAKMENE